MVQDEVYNLRKSNQALSAAAAVDFISATFIDLQKELADVRKERDAALAITKVQALVPSKSVLHVCSLYPCLSYRYQRVPALKSSACVWLKPLV